MRHDANELLTVKGCTCLHMNDCLCDRYEGSRECPYCGSSDEHLVWCRTWAFKKDDANLRKNERGQ